MTTPNRRYPGFLIRRLQQVSVSLFLHHLRPVALTPLQFTLLRLAADHAGTDQISLAVQAMLDPSTVKDVVNRLEARGLLTRQTGARDRRTRSVTLTAQGAQLLAAAKPQVSRAQKELLAPLGRADQARLLDLMARLLAAHEGPADGATAKTPWRRAAASRPPSSRRAAHGR